MKKLPRSLVKAFSAIVGKENISTDPVEFFCYATNASQVRYQPWGILFPASGKEVAQILKLATSRSIPIIPRGAGTGLVNASQVEKDGVILSTARINHIKIDPFQKRAVCGAGVVSAELNNQAQIYNLFYPITPTSNQASTLGGSIAANIHSLRQVKYGPIENYVESLELATTSGELLTIKAGSDNPILPISSIIGSRGALGIITEASLRLVPKPASTLSCWGFFPSYQGLWGAARELQLKVPLSIMEVLDAKTTRIMAEKLSLKFPDITQASLLLEIEGLPSSLEQDTFTVKDIFHLNGGDHLWLTDDKEKQERLWKSRNHILPWLMTDYRIITLFSVEVARSRLDSFIASLEEDFAPFFCWGHLSDGCFHLAVSDIFRGSLGDLKARLASFRKNLTVFPLEKNYETA